MPLAGAVTDEIVGAVRSIVMGVVARASLKGPFVEVTVPKSEFANILGIREPSPHEETVNVKFDPELALIAKMQPVAVPALVKSVFAIPEAFCESTIEKVISDEVFVGDVVDDEKVVGETLLSYVIRAIP